MIVPSSVVAVHSTPKYNVIMTVIEVHMNNAKIIIIMNCADIAEG